MTMFHVWEQVACISMDNCCLTNIFASLPHLGKEERAVVVYIEFIYIFDSLLVELGM